MSDIDTAEEQQLEFEAMESIFVGEFELIHEDPLCYEIIINADREDDDNNFVVIQIKIEYPADYPKVVPKCQFKNLSPKHLTLSEFNHWHTIFRKTAEELVGEQMMFEIVEKIREYLIEKNDVFIQQKIKDEEEEKIREENAGKKYIAETRLDYTPVNKDTFSDWLKKFQKARDLKKVEELSKRTKVQVERDNRITGKYYFLEKQGIEGSGINFEEDEVDALIDDDDDETEEVKDEGEDQAKYFDEAVFYDEGLDDVDFD